MENNETGVRASDAERERYAGIVGAATGDGRLTTGEADERLAAIYAARFRHELDPLVRDLPKPKPESIASTMSAVNWRRGPLAVHAAIVAVIAVGVMVHWVAVGAGFFFPAIPLLWLGASLVVHARIRRARGSLRAQAPAAP